jgi:two-component system phosphate regulon response regulator PhoB
MARVLVVDDDPDICEVLVWALETAEHEAQSCGPLPVFERIASYRPDVILLDLMMPGPGTYEGFYGEEVFRRVRAEPNTAAIPIIIMSAANRVRERAEALGARHWFAKPLDIYELFAAIERVLAPET